MAKKNEYETLKNEINKIIENINNSYNEQNLFSILNLETKELIHSRFIAYLLAPNGDLKSGNFKNSLDCPSHNYGKTLTNTLLDAWGIEYDGRYTVDVCIEYEHKLLEGRIDILIKVGTKLIAIENKIYAGDQELQLKRYHDFLTRQKKSKKNSDVEDIELIYLTLDGREASALTTGENQFDYDLLSYSTIGESLNDCKKIIEKDDPLLTYISEYQNVINKLVPDYVIANKIIENGNWKYINKILNDNDLKETVKERLNKFVYPYLIENVLKPNISGKYLYPENNNLYMWIKSDGKKEYDIFFTIEDGIIKYFPICIDSSKQKPKWYCGVKDRRRNWLNWTSKRHWNNDILIIKNFLKKIENIKNDIIAMKEFINQNECT